MRRRSATRRAWCLATALACPAAGAFAASMVSVSQVGRAFAVASVHVARGDTIRFTNDDRFDHQVFVDAPGFKFQSAEQAPGEAVEMKFTAAGTFDVQCQIHPRMHLAVTVD